MEREKDVVFAGARRAVSAMTCALAIATLGWGAPPDTVGTRHDKGSRSRTDQTSWAKEQYPATWGVVQSFLATQPELKGRTISRVTALYRPEIEGPAYLDFALRSGSEDAGYVIASTGGHSAPIHAWSETGSSAALLTDVGTLTAESPNGSIPEDMLSDQYQARIAKEWERAATTAAVPLPPDVAGSPLCPVDGCGGDPCIPGSPNYPQCLCPGSGIWRTRGYDIALPPNISQFSAYWSNGYCRSGCTPTAIAIVAGWISHQAGDRRDGSPWGHPRMAYAYDQWGLDAWAPQTPNPDDSDPYTYNQLATLRSRLDTTCSGAAGLTRYIPYNRIKNISQAYFDSIGAPVNTASYYNGSWEGYMGWIENEIKAGRPVEVNAMDGPYGENAHSWVIWGYDYTCFGEWYGINLSSDPTPSHWIAKSVVLHALTDSVTSGADGAGLVMFRPRTTRDHGPITTGAGSNYCLDVSWADQSNGAPVKQYSCWGGDNQLWYLDRNDLVTPGWQIRVKHSGKCLAPWDGGSYDGAAVVQWDCDKADVNTLWRIEKMGTRVRIRHVISDNCLDLDNSGGMAGEGKKIQVWACNGWPNQLFDFGY